MAAILDAEDGGHGAAGARRTLAVAGIKVAGSGWDHLLNDYFTRRADT